MHEQLLWSHACAVHTQISRGERAAPRARGFCVGRGRMVCAIHPNADHRGRGFVRAYLALDQDTGALAACQQKIIRPFEAKLRCERGRRSDYCIAQRKSCDERQLRRTLERRRIGQEQACVKIARRRIPSAAKAAATGALFGCSNPKRPAFAAAGANERFRIGRADGGQGLKPDTRRDGARIEPHQNSD